MSDLNEKKTCLKSILEELTKQDCCVAFSGGVDSSLLLVMACEAAEENKKRYGEDFYANIGRKGGKAGHTGGFAADPELARRAGTIGGKKSKRGPAKKKEEEKEEE